MPRSENNLFAMTKVKDDFAALVARLETLQNRLDDENFAVKEHECWKTCLVWIKYFKDCVQVVEEFHLIKARLVIVNFHRFLDQNDCLFQSQDPDDIFIEINNLYDKCVGLRGYLPECKNSLLSESF